MCVTTYRFSVDCHIFRLPRVTSRSSHVVVLTLTNSSRNVYRDTTTGNQMITPWRVEPAYRPS